jgi:hypothetical protein
MTHPLAISICGVLIGVSRLGSSIAAERRTVNCLKNGQPRAFAAINKLDGDEDESLRRISGAGKNYEGRFKKL